MRARTASRSPADRIALTRPARYTALLFQSSGRSTGAMDNER
jgi:hypothetical protein